MEQNNKLLLEKITLSLSSLPSCAIQMALLPRRVRQKNRPKFSHFQSGLLICILLVVTGAILNQLHVHTDIIALYQDKEIISSSTIRSRDANTDTNGAGSGNNSIKSYVRNGTLKPETSPSSSKVDDNDQDENADEEEKKTDGNNNNSLHKEQDTTTSASTDQAPVKDENEKDITKVDKKDARTETENKDQNIKSTAFIDQVPVKDEKDNTIVHKKDIKAEIDNKEQDTIDTITTDSTDEASDEDDKDNIKVDEKGARTETDNKDEDATPTASTDQVPVEDGKDNTKVDKNETENENKDKDTTSTASTDEASVADDKESSTKVDQHEANTESDNKVQDIKSITSTTAEDTNDKDDKDITSNTTDTSSSSSLSSCTFQNSQEWLNGPRISNIDEEEMTDELIQDLILHVSPMDEESHGSKNVLAQTLCHKESGFLNWDRESKTRTKSQSETKDERKIRAMAFRLMFLALHEHQYGPAREEALVRYGEKGGCESGKALSESGVGRMDYECPNTKFLLTTGSNVGLGASIRMGMVDPLFLGLASNRVTLIMNGLKPLHNATADLSAFAQGWNLSNCARKDMQCTFMPLSPCTITEHDMKNGKFLDKNAVNFIRDYGELPPEYEDEKVVIVAISTDVHHKEPSNLRDKIVTIISSFYSSHKDHMSENSKQAWQLDDAMVDQVKDYIKGSNQIWLPHQAAGFYAMRPNMHSRSHIDQEIDRIFPQDYDPRTAVGLPIRASDKCRRESQCMNFTEQLDLLTDWVDMRTRSLRNQDDNTLIDKIVLTSEDSEVVKARLNYPKSESFPFAFIINDADVGQSSGNPKVESFQKRADQILLDSLVAMKMQLNTDSATYNSCSNFHKIMYDQSLHDCGVQNYVEWYQENDNPKYRMKCGWQ